jgi:serine/threonine protein kinase
MNTIIQTVLAEDGDTLRYVSVNSTATLSSGIRMAVDAGMYEFLRNPGDYKTEGEPLGSGQYGTVYLAVRMHGDRPEEVALKQSHKPLSDFRSQQLFLREISILAKMHTRLCLPLLGFWIPEESTMGPVILSPLMKNDTLDSAIAANTLTPTQVLKNAYGIAYGMRICHGYDIVRRDLKPENVFLSETFEPVIADFGLSKCLKGGVGASMAAGSPLYMAPEMIKKESSDKPLDVYSYAVTLYCLIGRTKTVVFEKRAKPFEAPYPLAMAVLASSRPKRIPSIPDWWWGLITRCWDQSPNERPTFDQIVASLDDDPGAILEGADAAAYAQYRAACHAEIVQGQVMPATMTQSLGDTATQPPVPGSQPLASLSATGGKRPRRSGSFDWK